MKHWASRFVVTYQVMNRSSVNVLTTDKDLVLAEVPFSITLPGKADTGSATVTATITVPAETSNVMVQQITNTGWGDSWIKSTTITKNNSTSWTITFNCWKTSSGTSTASTLNYIAYCFGKESGAYVVKKPTVSRVGGGSISGGGTRYDNHNIPVGSIIQSIYATRVGTNGGAQLCIIGSNIDANGKTTSTPIQVEVWNQGNNATGACYTFVSYI